MNKRRGYPGSRPGSLARPFNRAAARTSPDRGPEVADPPGLSGAPPETPRENTPFLYVAAGSNEWQPGRPRLGMNRPTRWYRDRAGSMRKAARTRRFTMRHRHAKP